METTERNVDSDENVPPSERGKSEDMPMEQRTPSAVFGLVGLSYLVVLSVIVLGLAAWMYLG